MVIEVIHMITVTFPALLAGNDLSFGHLKGHKCYFDLAFLEIPFNVVEITIRFVE